jgi:excisionase family DNA binding protein
MTIHEVAAYLHVAPGTIHHWIKRKNFPRMKIGRLLRFTLVDVDQWVTHQTLKADALAMRNRHPRLGRHDPSQAVVFNLD